MFKDKTSSAIVSVSDIDRARDFYENTLGLEPIGNLQEAIGYRTGGTKLIIYPSSSAGSNTANAVVWSVPDDFDAVADELRAKNVVFEEYPDMGMEIRDGVHIGGDFKSVWFKDPDGNILHFNNM